MELCDKGEEQQEAYFFFQERNLIPINTPVGHIPVLAALQYMPSDARDTSLLAFLNIKSIDLTFTSVWNISKMHQLQFTLFLPVPTSARHPT
jgi:hypothetical protein